MIHHPKIPASDEAWDSGQLGSDEEFVEQVREDIESQIDEALQLQPISIRLQKSLIEDLKAIATLHGLGYQPLMRQILWRFADCEKKHILNQRVIELQEKQETIETDDENDTRKRA